MICTAIAISCPWLPNLIRATGITGGYEVPCLGIMGAVVLVGMALIRYGYFDSISLAGENALGHGKEGIMVIDNYNRITYFNKRIEEVFDRMIIKCNAYEHPVIKDILLGNTKHIEKNDSIYEMRVEPLREGGYVQGHMIWMLDVTEHQKMLAKISDMAHKDSLTGVYNRNYFITLFNEYMQQDGSGSLIMMDLSNFKQINDRYGHQAGDDILTRFGEVLLAQGEDVLACRIGGDEFCIFCKEAIDAKELELIMVKILREFKESVRQEKYAELVGASFGVARLMEASDREFERLYSTADKALYVAKNRSKQDWYIL